MGLLRNTGSAPGAARKPYEDVRHPLRPGASRPVNPAESSVQDGVSRGSRGRTRGGRRGKRADGSVPTYVPVDDSATAAERASSAHEAAIARAQLAAVIRQRESALFALHMDAEPTLRRPTAQAPDTPDPAPERARTEQELGMVALASSLEEYGTPPVAPQAEHADRDALERELLSEALTGVSRWRVSARRSLLNQVREQASRQAEAEDERLAAEQQQLQRELDARWAQLNALRDRAAHDVDQWVSEEIRRREAVQAEQQAVLDSEWQRLIDADPSSVTETLRAAFHDGTVTVLGSLDGIAVLIVACPDIDDVIADKEPAFTGVGRPTVNARSEIRRNDLYLSAIASRVLAAVGRALSTTPAVEAVTCVAVRPCGTSDRPWEPIYVGTFQRAYAERLLAEGRWSPEPEALAEAVEEAEEVDLELTGRTYDIAALDLSDDPGLMAVMDQMDPAIRSDESAARTSDQEAVETFLGYGGTEQDTDDEKRGDELADLQRDTDRAAAEPPSGAESTHDEPAHDEPTPDGPTHDGPTHDGPTYDGPTRERSPDGLAPSQDATASQRDGDPLREALKDSDGCVRRAAVEAISRRNDPSDTPLLLEALKDHDDIVRLEAIYAVKDRLTPDMRRDALIKACSDVDEGVRRKAFEALAELGDERDTPLLVKALTDSDSGVRLEAIYAVKERSAPDLRDALIKACGDVDESVRRKAFEALAELGDERDTPLLLTALKDRDDNVRLEAIYAVKERLTLDMRRDALIKACSDVDASVRRKAFEALAELGDERDTPLLVKALTDSDSGVRLQAIYAVKERSAPDMRDDLITACSDIDEGVRRKAFEALAELGDERDTPLLLKALKDPDSSVRLEAIYAVEARSTLGCSSRLSGPLSEAMKDEDASVRQAAVRLFGRLEHPRTGTR
jgi:HEAT repeat protein